MKEFTYLVTDELGIHARPAGQLVKLVSGFKSKVTLKGAKGECDMKRLMAVMKLSVKQNEEVTVTAEGEDEEAAIAAIADFLKANF